MRSSFFFYHHLKNHALIRELGVRYRAKKGTILVDEYDPISGHLSLGTMNELDGLLVSFDEDSVDILNKLGAMHRKIQLPGKSRYVVDTVLVNDGEPILKKAYIIY